MSDADVRRLEDRIDAVNREGQLRLDVVMARIDGKLDVIATGMAAIGGDLTQMKGALTTSVASNELRYRDLRTLIINSAIAGVIAVAATLIALKQVWIGGVQVGQMSQSAPQVDLLLPAPQMPPVLSGKPDGMTPPK